MAFPLFLWHVSYGSGGGDVTPSVTGRVDVKEAGQPEYQSSAKLQ